MTKDDLDYAFLSADLGTWTADMVLMRYFEAVHTLRRLPERWKPARIGSVMPPYARHLDDEFGPPEVAEGSRREPVRREAIDRMEEVFDWHANWLSQNHWRPCGQAAWVYSEARNGRFSLRQASKHLRVSPPTLHKRSQEAFQMLAHKLQASADSVCQPDYDLCFHFLVK